MQLVNEFTVDAPLAATWAVLTDIPTVVQCIPGAQLERREGDDYYANVGVRVGPIGMTLAGKATLASQDDDAREMVVRGMASDRKGNGSTEATVRLIARDAAGRSTVTVTTDLELSGRIAQFGKGAIVPVSNRIVGQFVDRLNNVIVGGDPPPHTPTRDVGRNAVATMPGDWIALICTGFAGVALGIAVGRWLDRLRPASRY
ncbi:SRPBCC family protein [Mycobacterium sp. pW049]|uniref:SRPBCC family protein n=1 Tax=[Mycobacterium] bulgaricum TaxID=3238985 RepID=UPI00351B3176